MVDHFVHSLMQFLEMNYPDVKLYNNMMSDSYTLWKLDTEDKYVIPRMMLLDFKNKELFTIIHAFNMDGSKGAEKAERLLKVKETKLWKAMNE